MKFFKQEFAELIIDCYHAIVLLNHIVGGCNVIFVITELV